MHHKIEYMAKSRFFDPEEFCEFTWAHRDRFHIVGSTKEAAMVSTWHANELADAFKMHLGDDYAGHRMKQIAIAQRQHFSESNADDPRPLGM